MSALWDFLPGFISAGVNTGKGSKCTAVCETDDIPDLSHKLGAKGWTDPVHRHDGGIFRQGGCCLIHLLAEGFHRSGCCVQHRHSLTYQHPGVVIFGEYRNQVRGETVYFLRFFGTEVIPSASAPVSVVFRKGIQGLAADTVHMPVGMDEIHLFLAAVTACRAVKEGIGTRAGLLNEGDEVIFHGSFLIARSIYWVSHERRRVQPA